MKLLSLLCLSLLFIGHASAWGLEPGGGRESSKGTS